MDPSVLIGLVVSALVPKLLELLKSKRWAVFIQPYGPFLNTITAGTVALLTALGVSVDYDAAAGVLTVTGLLPGELLRTGVTWLVNWAVQEFVYRGFIHQPGRIPGRRKLIVPLLLAVGLGAGCAKVAPALVAGEKSVRTTIVQVSETIEPLVCAVEARKVLTSRPCLQLLDALEPATELAIAYNRALASGRPPDIVATIAAIDKLIDAVKAVVPAGPAKDAAFQDLVIARVRAEGGK